MQPQTWKEPRHLSPVQLELIRKQLGEMRFLSQHDRRLNQTERQSDQSSGDLIGAHNGEARSEQGTPEIKRIARERVDTGCCERGVFPDHPRCERAKSRTGNGYR